MTLLLPESKMDIKRASTRLARSMARSVRSYRRRRLIVRERSHYSDSLYLSYAGIHDGRTLNIATSIELSDCKLWIVGSDKTVNLDSGYRTVEGHAWTVDLFNYGLGHGEFELFVGTEIASRTRLAAQAHVLIPRDVVRDGHPVFGQESEASLRLAPGSLLVEIGEAPRESMILRIHCEIDGAYILDISTELEFNVVWAVERMDRTKVQIGYLNDDQAHLDVTTIPLPSAGERRWDVLLGDDDEPKEPLFAAVPDLCQAHRTISIPGYVSESADQQHVWKPYVAAGRTLTVKVEVVPRGSAS